MPRSIPVLFLIGFIPLLAGADTPPIEKQLTIQKAMVTARQYLQVNMPTEAVATLEAELPNADGNKAFVTLLREAYLSELAVLLKDPSKNPAREAQVRRNLSLLTGDAAAAVASPSAAPAPAVPAPNFSDSPARPTISVEVGPADTGIASAKAAFKKRDYVEAERLFAAAGASKLTPEHKTAWAYCRIHIAADRVNAPACDAATAVAAEKAVQEAISLAPQNAELQKVGQQVIAAAKLRAGGAAAPVAVIGSPTDSNLTDAVETASFRVRYSGNKELAASVARAAEDQRREIFERWSGPAGGPWEPKCEIVLYATAADFSRATNRPAGGTGNAAVRLVNGRATERRIDLRADDSGVASNSLPRELTHVVLADLFPDKPPPRWAEEGMAVLAGSSEEAGRYTQTLRRCAREGEWFGVSQLMEFKDFPAEKVTGFYCESVSLADYLVRLRGEKYFLSFLRDCQRYGTPQALKRQYQMESPQALEAAWKRSALEITRGQAP
jgi:hypothetical protein